MNRLALCLVLLLVLVGAGFAYSPDGKVCWFDIGLVNGSGNYNTSVYGYYGSLSGTLGETSLSIVLNIPLPGVTLRIGRSGLVSNQDTYALSSTSLSEGAWILGIKVYLGSQ